MMSLSPTNLIIMGAGQVGRELLRIIIDNRASFVKRFGVQLNIEAIGDSSGYIFSHNDTLNDGEILECVEWKNDGKTLSQHPLFSLKSNQDISHLFNSSSILIDTSASDNTATLLIEAMNRGAKIVLANKKPLTNVMRVFKDLTSSGRLFRLGFESTVGAGTPFIASLIKLVLAGEKVYRVEGVLSGTLGFVMTGLQEGKSFSSIVLDARNRGFTEPDPRDDLSGFDVARKALIIARTLGVNAEMNDVLINALFPSSFQGISVDDFMSRLSQLDDDFAKQVDEARSRQCVLRYVASVCIDADGKSPASIAVGIRAVAAESALGQLSGTDNLMQVVSANVYSASYPLVVRGTGAGARVTANGVLADIMRLAAQK